MEPCLVYFRAALTDPESVPSWADWWAVNEELVMNTFPMFDYVRLKHRHLLGAKQVLQNRGEWPKEQA